MTSNVKSKNIPFSWFAFCLSLDKRDIRAKCSSRDRKNVEVLDLIPPHVIESIISPVDDFLSPCELASIVDETDQDRKLKEVLQTYDPLS